MHTPYEWTRVTWEVTGEKQMPRSKTIRIPVRKANSIRQLTRIMLCLLGLLSLSLGWLYRCSGACSNSTLALTNLKKQSLGRAHTDGTANRRSVNGKDLQILTPRTSSQTPATSDTTIPNQDDGYVQRILQQSTRDTSTIKVLNDLR